MTAHRTRRAIAFRLNGQPVEVAADPGQTLLHLLREECGLTGTKCGCEVGECGACTVILDGEAVCSCLVLAGQVPGRSVETVEGLAPAGSDELHPLQQAFLDCDAVACGFCTPGMLMAAKALLDANPAPTRREIEVALSGNLCRCTGYAAIIEAVERAAELLRQADGGRADTPATQPAPADRSPADRSPADR